MTLLALQRDFRHWLTSESADAAARFDDAATPGLAVYLNTYRAQLMACLAEGFATTLAWLGDDAFEAAAASHVDRLPPHSWTLDAYVLDFPETLDLLYPDDAEVAELARLESALGVAFVGADAASVDPATLADIDWERAVLGFVPTLTVLPCLTNSGAIWSAIAGGEPPPAACPLPEPAQCAVWRNDFIPAFRMLDADEADVLGLALDGQSFGAICAHLIARHGEEDGPAMAGAFLGQWLGDGILREVTTEDER